ncbi:MAG TPA: L-histidine N(alpha)-methyltransferase [Candidatus Xenobia bacterium]|nr:L-histidine N(alpha)-methyltransferase [Candidatus Xenobia bacterium]
MERRITEGISAAALADFAADVRESLSKPQKELPSKYLYDAVGSALFEVICELPEYGLHRAEARLFRRYAGDMVEGLRSPVVVAELGSGSGKKTRYLLEALARRQPVTYYPIDISHAALERCRAELGSIDSVSIVGFERAYLDGLLEVAARRLAGEQLLLLFLGSTIGNFNRPAGEAFLREVRRILQPGDALLLATDLEKPMAQLLLAYDDPLGVTAAFNLNLLARINRELGGDFVLSQFRHQARWSDAECRIEMHLVSQVNQTANIPGAGLTVTLRAGETIWTESCHKYNSAELVEMARRSGYRCAAQWVDAEWPYAQSLFLAE